MSHPASASTSAMAVPRLPEPPVTKAARPRRSTADLRARRAGRESPRLAVAADAPRGRMVEMRAEHRHRSVGVALAELPARLARLVGIGVEARRPLRLGHLDRMVHEVAGDHRPDA